MTHFRGQIRGPHWGPSMDNLLIDFWRKHECLYNSSASSYHDRDLKTRMWSEFASSIGKSVSDVERRSRSLRTQYGRVLYHPERVHTAQQEMLREKLDFLRPYIVRRRVDPHLVEKFEENEEPETEGSIDQEMGSSFGSPLDADETGPDLDDEPPSGAAALRCPNQQPQVTDVVSLSCLHHHNDAGSSNQTASKHDLLNQFAEVMLADMRHIKDPMVLMRLRRDITDLVFKAVEEDAQRSCSRPEQACSQTDYSWRQKFLKRESKGCEVGRRKRRRWEEMEHTRRTSRSQLSQPVQRGQAVDLSSSQVIVQASEIKRETDAHTVKTEEEILPLA